MPVTILSHSDVLMKVLYFKHYLDLCQNKIYEFFSIICSAILFLHDVTSFNQATHPEHFWQSDLTFIVGNVYEIILFQRKVLLLLDLNWDWRQCKQDPRLTAGEWWWLLRGNLMHNSSLTIWSICYAISTLEKTKILISRTSAM